MSNTKGGKTGNILVVDDELDNLRLLTDVLSRQGYVVRPIPNGNLALAAIKAEPPDLILLDILMPFVDGYEVCRQLKADRETRDIPIIFLSALSETVDKVKAFALGGVDYITKPFQIEEVIVRIENQLKICRLQKQLQRKNELLQQEILERQLLAAKLQSSQMEIRAFFESMSDIVMMISADGEIIKVAPTNAERFYLPNTDIVGKTVAQFFGEAGEVFRSYIRRALETQQVVNCEYSLEIESGKAWFAASITPTAENTVAWVSRDISDRKILEQELASREARLNAFFNCSPVGMSIVDEQLRYVQINQTLAEINGYSCQDHIGKTFLELTPNIAPSLEPIYRQVLTTGESIFNVQITREIPSQPGILRYWKVSYFPILEQDNRPTSVGTVMVEITDNKRAELELKSVSQRLEYLLTSSPGVIFSCKVGGNYGATYISQNVSEVVGYQAEEFLADSGFWSRHIHPEDADRVFVELATQLPLEDFLSYEYRFLHKNGTYRWMSDRLRLIRDAAGNPIEYIGYWIDITERKEAELALQASQRRYQILAEASPVCIFNTDAQGNCLYVNQQWTKITGLTLTEALGKVWTSTLHPEDKERVLSEWTFATEARLPFKSEYRFQHPDGKITWVIGQAIAEIGDDGEVKGYVGTIADIGDLKAAELMSRESAEREKSLSSVIQKMRQTLDIETIFAATTSELRQVMKCDRVLIYQFNPDWSGQFVAESVESNWNSLWEQSDSITNNTIDDKNCAVRKLSNINNFVRDTYLQETQGGIYNQGIHYLAIADIYQTEFTPCYIELLERLQTKAYITVPIFCGDRLWGLLAVYQNSHPRQWKEAEISTVVHIGHQLGIALQQAELLTQTKKQSEALQQALIAADTANRAKSEFLANMSHELRTPLNAILGFSQVMSRDNSLSIENKKSLGIINRAGEHLLSLIDDILEMSKIEAGRTTFNESSFDFIQLLENLQNMLQMKAAAKGLKLSFEFESNLPQYIKTDAGKLRQVLLNLLGNALKFTQEGSVTLRVKKLSDDRLFFEVEDTGTGIAPEEIHLLFEAFGQTETGRKSGKGTGLGLPISQKYAQLMDGNITVSSVPDLGSIFSFDIQISLAEASEIQINNSQSRVIHLAPGQPEYRILVVDDALESRLFLVKLLASLGFSVREAENGQEAVDNWKNWQPHLILMDMRMPIMDGYEATKIIRIEESNRGRNYPSIGNLFAIGKTVIFALTASVFEEHQETFLSFGCDDLIRKPFQVEILLEKIKEYLGTQYVYDGENGNADSEHEATEIVLTEAELSDLLSQMSPEWVAQVHQAASECSDESVLELVGLIPPENSPLAKALTELAQNFQFRRIIEITQDSST